MSAKEKNTNILCKKQNIPEAGLYFCAIYHSQIHGTRPILQITKISPNKQKLLEKFSDIYEHYWDGHEFFFRYYNSYDLIAAQKFDIVFDFVIDSPLEDMDYKKIQLFLDSGGAGYVNYISHLGKQLDKKIRFDLEIDQ